MKHPSFYTPEQVSSFPSLSLSYLKVKQNGHIFTITLSRPEKRNAFNQPMAEEIALTLEYANAEKSIRCIIINAEGPVFCAGADLEDFLGPGEGRRLFPTPRKPVNLGEAFSSLHKPSVAQIEGPVLAGGFLILCGVTLAVSVPEATFSLPEVKRGLWPMQVMASLARVVPPRKLLEMCITAKRYTAEEALASGLISEISGSGTIQNTVERTAEEIVANAPFAISRGMEIYQSLLSNEESLYSDLQKELNLLIESDDAKEGILAFREKREPVWKNS